MRKLQIVTQGHSSKAIVHQLFISECAVALHLTAIFNKVGVNTRAQLAAVGWRSSWRRERGAAH